VPAPITITSHCRSAKSHLHRDDPLREEGPAQAEEPDHGGGSSPRRGLLLQITRAVRRPPRPSHRHDRRATKKSRIRDENRLTVCGVMVRGRVTAATDRMVWLAATLDRSDDLASWKGSGWSFV